MKSYKQFLNESKFSVFLRKHDGNVHHVDFDTHKEAKNEAGLVSAEKNCQTFIIDNTTRSVVSIFNKGTQQLHEGKPTVKLNTVYTAKTIVRTLVDLGWKQITDGSSGHAKFKHPNSNQVLAIPLNHSGDLHKGMTHKIIKTAMRV